MKKTIPLFLLVLLIIGCTNKIVQSPNVFNTSIEFTNRFWGELTSVQLDQAIRQKKMREKYPDRSNERRQDERIKKLEKERKEQEKKNNRLLKDSNKTDNNVVLIGILICLVIIILILAFRKRGK